MTRLELIALREGDVVLNHKQKTYWVVKFDVMWLRFVAYLKTCSW